MFKQVYIYASLYFITKYDFFFLQGFLIHALALSPSFCGFLSSFEEI